MIKTITLHKWISRHLTYAEREVVRLKQLQRRMPPAPQPVSDVPAPMPLDEPVDIFFWQGRRAALLDLERLLDTGVDVDLGAKRGPRGPYRKGGTE